MQKTKKIWLDGNLVDWKNAKTHIFSHALHYGTAVFEGIRCYKTDNDPAIFRLQDHLDRLLFSARCLGMKLPFGKGELISAIKITVKINKAEECYIRPIAFYGYGKMSLNPIGVPVNVAIGVWPWKYDVGKGENARVKISKYIRLHPASIEARAKISGYYSNSVLAAVEAYRAGVDECVFLDKDGYVAEGPGENIFLVKNKKLYTPAPGSILPGITRDSIMKIARDLKIRVIERKITPAELKEADEVFFCGTAVEICPIIKLGGHNFMQGKTGPITNLIRDKYRGVVRGEVPKYSRWLTYIK